MTIWSSIKKFLNSSLGTKDFKALDNQLLEGWNLEASDDIYYTLFSGDWMLGKTAVKKFRAYLDGTIRVKAWNRVNVWIYVNDILVADNNSDELTFTCDITLSKGDILKIEANDASTGLYLQICATETKKVFSEQN